VSFDMSLDFDTSQHDATHETTHDHEDSGVYMDDGVLDAKFEAAMRSQLPAGG
jgi:hypothetical protein